MASPKERHSKIKGIALHQSLETETPNTPQTGSPGMELDLSTLFAETPECSIDIGLEMAPSVSLEIL